MTTYRLSYKGELHEFDSLSESQKFIDGLPDRENVEILEAPRLFMLLNYPGAPLANWSDIADEIDKEWKAARTSAYRESLLSIFKTTMELVETTLIAPENTEKFRDNWQTHYRTFIVEEALIGKTVCVQTLDELTRREIAAGRLAPDDPLRKGAEAALAAPHASRAELEGLNHSETSKRSGVLRRVIGNIFRAQRQFLD
jgi:hypothetical protein